MSKLRIHELAKMLDKSNKEIMNVLKEKNVEVRSHMSSIEAEHVDMVKAYYNKENVPTPTPVRPAERTPQRPAQPKPAPQRPQNQKDDAAAEPAKSTGAAGQPEAGKEEAPKKRNITQVFRPQNSKNANYRGRGQQQRPQQQARPAGGQQQQAGAVQSQQVRGAAGQQQQRPQQQARPAAGQGQQQRPQQQARPAGGQQQRPQQQTRPAGGQQQARPAAGQGQQQRPQQQARPAAGQQRPQGQQQQARPAAGQQRPQGQGQQRPQGQGQQRPQQQARPAAGQQRPQGQGQQRPQGQGQQRPQQQARPAGGQGGNRPQQNGNRQNQNNRFGNNNQGRNDRGDRVSIPPVEMAGKPGAKDAGRHGNGHSRNNQGTNRPNQGGNRPNQGGNRPNQRRNNQYGRGMQKPAQQPQQKKEETIRNIELPAKMTIKELADKMKVQPSVLIKKLFLQGIMVTVNHEIEYDQAEELALEFNCIAEPEVVVDVIEELLKEDEEDEAALKARPPVVCVMGHVDHGKTSLLDAIRKTNVIDREAGGITQHIGAYVVKINGQNITFLDTPGHEAFTAMRMRGASSTDVAILVVAADDGVMPQTVEAINHAKAAGVEIIVAINKIDKPGANIERVKQELAEHELIPEDWGGSTVFVPVSAKSHEGIEQLLEMILLTADILELKANPKRKARGLVIEAELDKGKGSVATVLVQKGTLKVGDHIAAGSSFGKVRAMMDDKGRRVKTAGPSVPVEILGLNDVPNAGEIFVATESDKEARNFAETFIKQSREKMLDDTKSRMSLDDLFTHIQAGNVKELNIIVKADVQGSVEAVKQSLVKLSNEEVVVRILHGGVGTINESDVTLASTSNAIIIGFNVRTDATAKELADREKVDVRLYKVIYNAIEDVEAAMKGMLDPVFEEKVIGHAEVRQIFKASGIGTIAGGYVLDGIFERGCKVRLKRGDKEIYDGPLASLKRFKDDVKEVKSGYECGLVLEKFNDIEEGDIAEAYKMVEVPR